MSDVFSMWATRIDSLKILVTNEVGLDEGLLERFQQIIDQLKAIDRQAPEDRHAPVMAVATDIAALIEILNRRSSQKSRVLEAMLVNIVGTP